MPVAKKKSRIKKTKIKKKIIKKPIKKAVKTKKIVKAPKLKAKIVGSITHYFPHVRAAVIKLKMPLAVGDKIKIKGHTTDFKQTITSMQIDCTPIQKAKKGDEIGLLVDSRVRRKDKISLL